MAITNKQLEMLNDPSTIVIVPGVGVDADIARSFLEANAPKALTEERVFDVLHVLTLQGKVKVACVYRNPRKPAYDYLLQVDGIRGHQLKPEKQLMDEVMVIGPIEPTYSKEGPMKPTVLNINKFLEEIGQIQQGFRFDYIDKGENRPQQLRLVST